MIIADVAAWLRAAIYNKWRELQKHSLPKTIPNRTLLELQASRLLRAEVRLMGMELKCRGLNKAHNWGWLGTGSEILKERIGLIAMSEKLRLTPREIAELPPRLVAVSKLWTDGDDLRGLYPKSTYC